MKPTLTDLARKYNSDKLHSHSYIPFYEQLFAGRNVRRLLEIGIGFADLMQPFVSPDAPYVHGSSLRMWEEFFPEAEIFACDIRKETLVNQGRIRSVVCDQSRPRSLHDMVAAFVTTELIDDMNVPVSGFDVILDDGSHQLNDQLTTFFALKEFLNEGAVYVIEDCQQPERLASETGGTIHRFDKRPDDCLVVVRKDRFDV